MIDPRPEVAVRLVELKQSGAAPVFAIKTIHEEFGLSLREAKSRFAASPEWAAEQAVTDALHKEIFDNLRIGNPD